MSKCLFVCLLLLMSASSYSQSNSQSNLERISQLESAIKEAVSQEDYELASKLKKEKEIREEIVEAINNEDYEKASSLKKQLNQMETVKEYEKKEALKILNQRLEKALESEDYEKAAEIKNEINEIENDTSQNREIPSRKSSNSQVNDVKPLPKNTQPTNNSGFFETQVFRVGYAYALGEFGGEVSGGSIYDAYNGMENFGATDGISIEWSLNTTSFDPKEPHKKGASSFGFWLSFDFTYMNWSWEGLGSGWESDNQDYGAIMNINTLIGPSYTVYRNKVGFTIAALTGCAIPVGGIGDLNVEGYETFRVNPDLNFTFFPFKFVLNLTLDQFHIGYSYTYFVTTGTAELNHRRTGQTNNYDSFDYRLPISYGVISIGFNLFKT